MAENNPNHHSQSSSPYPNLPNSLNSSEELDDVLDSIFTNIPTSDYGNDDFYGASSNLILEPNNNITDVRSTMTTLPCLDGDWELQRYMLQMRRTTFATTFSASTSNPSRVQERVINKGYEHNILQNRIHYPPPINVSSNQRPRIRLPLDIRRDYVPYGPRSNNDNIYRHENGRRGGRILETRARDHGYDFKSLKMIIEDGNWPNIETEKIIERMIDHLHTLIFDKDGNDLVQSILRSCSENFLNEFSLSLIMKKDLFISACLHNPAHKSVLTMLERLKDTFQKTLIASLISSHIFSFTSSFNGHEVLKQCYESFSQKDNQVIIQKIAERSVEIGKDKAGCYILQGTIRYAKEEVRERLVAPLIQNAVCLSLNRYGNYIIQFIIALGVSNITTRVMKKLQNSHVEFCLNQFASHVVEKCLIHGQIAEVERIIFEIIESQHFLHILTNEYGNFVVQKAITKAQGQTYNYLLMAIKRHSNDLEENPYGKRIAAAVRREESTNRLYSF